MGLLFVICFIFCLYCYCCCQMRSSVTWMRSRLQHYFTPLRHYKWMSKAEFIVSSIGYCIGFGNLWRFPYIVHKNGGGAFILSYTISMMFISLPMFYLECALGQFTGCNPIAAFNFAPACKGIGLAMTLLPVYVCLYHVMILVYSLKFTLVSFANRLPWEFCDSSWGADGRCYERKPGNDTTLPYCSTNQTWTNKTNKQLTNVSCLEGMPSTEQYWQKAILHLDDGSGKKYSLEDIGVVQWDLILALMVCWLAQYVVVSRGLRSITKVAHYTTAFSFIIVICMVVNALRLDNSIAGLEHLFVPNWEELLRIELWVDSISHALFSTGICFGCIILYSSYNRFHSELLKSVFFILFVAYVVNILSAMTVFSILGCLAEEMEVDIKEVVEKGPGIIFVVMPKAIAKLPVPQFWSFLYFIMLFSMGINSQAAQLDAFITSIYEQVPRLKHYIVTMQMSVCFILFSLSIPFTTNIVLVLGIPFGKSCENYSRVFCIGGWTISLTIVIQVPIIAIYTVVKYYKEQASFTASFQPIYTWGPRDVVNKVMYLDWQKRRGMPLGFHTATGLAELEAEGMDVQSSVEDRIKQRKYSVFYRFSKVFMEEELEGMAHDNLDEPSTSR